MIHLPKTTLGGRGREGQDIYGTFLASGSLNSKIIFKLHSRETYTKYIWKAEIFLPNLGTMLIYLDMFFFACIKFSRNTIQQKYFSTRLALCTLLGLFMCLKRNTSLSAELKNYTF